MHSRFLVQLLSFLALLGGATGLYLGRRGYSAAMKWKKFMASRRAGEVARRYRIRGAMMEISATISSFLTHVKVEKGLSSNTV